MTAVLITGAGSGIGRELVNRAVARGDRVIATVRQEKDLPSFGNHNNLRVLLMNVGSTQSVEAGFAELDSWLAGTPLNAVINSAAICPLGALEIQPIEVIEQTLNTNAVGSARVLRASLPRLRGHDGRIALVTSLWGKVSGPMLSAYCASKFAIEAIADATRRETKGHGVHIMVVEPGVVRTSMVDGQVSQAQKAAAEFKNDANYGALYAKYSAMISRNAGGGLSATECAAAIEKAVFAKKPKTRYQAGSDSKAITLLARLLPDSAIDRMFTAMLK
ncbi:MAG: SDR family NAD(P)-dependent oxidoreductase [Steroidobacteraceae bacterium]